MADDEFVAGGEEAERRSAAARLFDVRRVIGGLFVVYGLLIGGAGLFDSPAEIRKAEGVRINLCGSVSGCWLSAYSSCSGNGGGPPHRRRRPIRTTDREPDAADPCPG